MTLEDGVLTKYRVRENERQMNFEIVTSVTRLGDLLHFGLLFKASGNNFFAHIAHISGNF